MTSEPERRIGEFRLHSRIGVGALGEVFLAEHPDHGRRCVVKILPRDLTSDPEFAARFEDGARRIAELDHPSIVRIHHFGRDGDDFFLAMDYVADARGPARSVQDLLDRGGGRRLGSARARRIAVQVLAALAHAHDRGVLHLCLKPSSVLLDGGGRVKLTDFGLGLLVGSRALSAHLSQAPADGTAVAPHLDEVADYLPPEERLGRADLDRRADIYSFGALLYRMLTGRRPGKVMARPSQLVRRLPPAWDAVVERCLEDHPEHRYSSASAVLEDVAAVRRSRPSFSPRRTLRLALIVLLLAGAAWLAVKAVDLAGGPAASVEWSFLHSVRLPGGVRMAFVPIPAGSFHMGDADTPDAPPATVSITRPYFLATTEVTQAQWRAVMGKQPATFRFGPEDDERPVECVSRDDCEWFIERLNQLGLGTFRLPTEAEWEYACRAGGGGRYPWGDDAEALDAFAWHPENANRSTHPVGRKCANAWGLRDMLGNVNEWCADRYAPYPPGERSDPAGPSIGREFVFRGGSYFAGKGDCRPAVRYHAARDVRIAFIGFRVVRDVDR